MSVARECFVLPGLFLTVTLLGGLRIAGDVRLIPPPLSALLLALLLVGCFVRARVLIPETFMHDSRTALENISGLVVLLSLFAACAQVFNLVTPEEGLLHVLFTVFFLVQLLTTLAAVRDRQLLLRGLVVLLGSAFVLRFIVLEALYSPEGGTLQRVLTILLEGVSLGTLGYAPNAAATGYLAFLALALFVSGLALLAPRTPGSLLPGSLGHGSLSPTSLRPASSRPESFGAGGGPPEYVEGSIEHDSDG